MMQIDQHTQQQIADLMNTCGSYWELRGIPREQRNEMRLELAQHLEQAVRDGKSLQAVVGGNALAFAESWTQETPHHAVGGFPLIVRWVLLDWLAYALAFLTFIALFEHVVLRGPSFAFTLTHLVAFAFIGMYTLIQAASGFFVPRFRNRENRLRFTFGIYAALSLLVLLVLFLTHAPLHQVLFRWDWPLTLLVLVGTIALFGAKIWLNRAQSQPISAIR
jgi:hypothetical protein